MQIGYDGSDVVKRVPSRPPTTPLESPPMLACVDVDYRSDHAVAASLLFRQWRDGREQRCLLERCASLEPYQSGQFYRRELPCVLAVLRRVRPAPEVVIVDGYVWLDAAGSAGLGAHLYRHYDERVAVIGVAKSAYGPCDQAAAVLRGKSSRPLYVTAAGVALDEAASRIRSMHGTHRIPTLLQQVDHACRNG